MLYYPLMEQSTSHLASLEILEDLMRNSISINYLERVKKILNDPRIDAKKFVEGAKDNEAVSKILADHTKAQKQAILVKLENEHHCLDYNLPPNQKDLLVWDFRNDLCDGEICLALTYPIKGKSQPSKHSIIDESDFNRFMKSETQKVFADMDWSNIVMVGDFLTKTILHRYRYYSATEFENIQLCIWGPTKEVVRAKYQYLYDFWQDKKPIYMVSNSMLHVIIPGFKHIIQIISYVGQTPLDIINQFDFNHQAFYYDGVQVHTTLRGFVALKYDLVIYNAQGRKFNSIESQLLETAKRGFKIQYNPDLKTLTTIIKDQYIDLTEFEANEKKDNKSFVFKSLEKIDESKHTGLITLMMEEFKIVSQTPLPIDQFIPDDTKTTKLPESTNATGAQGPSGNLGPRGPIGTIRSQLNDNYISLEKVDYSNCLLTELVSSVNNSILKWNPIFPGGVKKNFYVGIDFKQANFYFGHGYPIATVSVDSHLEEVLRNYESKVSTKLGQLAITMFEPVAVGPSYSPKIMIAVHMRNRSSNSLPGIILGGILPVEVNVCLNVASKKYFIEFTY
jgi:hypothetical protein